MPSGHTAFLAFIFLSSFFTWSVERDRLDPGGCIFGGVRGGVGEARGVDGAGDAETVGGGCKLSVGGGKEGEGEG